MRLVQDFYNKTPFPDYELSRFNSKEDLKTSAYASAQFFDKSIPEDASVIDVGTGTGMFSAFLSLRRKCVWGIDFSRSSLSKATQLKEKLNLNSLTLRNVDIMDNKQIEDIGIKFDYLLCLGVLHHTEDAYQAFKNILTLLKPNGYVAIGLYNKFGRIPLKIRKIFTRTIFKNNQKVKNKFIKMQIGYTEDKERVRGWWNDQYLHPHETCHTIGEVLKWFKKNNITYCRTIPSSSPFDEGDIEITGVWSKEVYPYFPIRTYAQLSWIWKIPDGGYWITLGRRNE